MLAQIQSEVSSIESFKRDTTDTHKRVVARMLLYFSAVYLVAAAVVYFSLFHDPEWRDAASRAALVAPFLVAPFA